MLDEERKHKHNTQTLISTWSYRLVLISCSTVMHITPNLVNQTETKEAGETQQSCHAQINLPKSIQTIDLQAIWVEDGEQEKKCRVAVGPKTKKMSQKTMGRRGKKNVAACSSNARRRPFPKNFLNTSSVSTDLNPSAQFSSCEFQKFTFSSRQRLFSLFGVCSV